MPFRTQLPSSGRAARGAGATRGRASRETHRARVARLSAGIVFAAVLAATGLGGAPGAARADERVDLNRATAAELAELPGIGDAKARAIIAHRDATPFRSVDDLRQVKGIGDQLLEQLRDKVTVSGAPSGAAEKKPAAGARATGERPAGS
jgi:competence protein ComEA